MRSLIIVFVFTAFAFAACTQQRSKDFDEISKFEKELTKDPMAPIDMEKGRKMGELYFNFVKKYPQDSLSPEFLLKSAEVYTSIGVIQKAIESLDKIIADYPEHELIPQSIHLLAFVYDDKVKDYEKAAENYNLLIKKYPNHDLAENAKGCLMLLGKSEEELLNELQKADSLAK